MKIVWLAWLLSLAFDVNAISFPAEVREVKPGESSGINQRPLKDQGSLYANEDENLINHRPGFSTPFSYTYSSEEDPREITHMTNYPGTGYSNQNSRIHGGGAQSGYSGWSGGPGAFLAGIISCNVCSPSTFHFTPDCCSEGNYQCCNSGHGYHGWNQGGGYSHLGASGYGQTQHHHHHQLTGAGYGGYGQGHSSSLWPSTSLSFLPSSFRGYGVFGKRKSGFCPIRLEAAPRCSLECRDDSECSGRRKCCSFGCASLCSDPFSPRDSLPYTGSFAVPPEDKGSTGLTKPGTCYRPYNQNAGYYFDRADSETNSQDEEQPKREKREASNELPHHSFGEGRKFGNKPHQGSSGSFGLAYGSYGGHGHNGWSGSSGPRSCHKDFECQGNQKCCSGFCLTPYFAG